MYGLDTDVRKPKKDTTEKWKLRVHVDGCEMLISLELGILNYPWVEK